MPKHVGIDFNYCFIVFYLVHFFNILN